MPMKVTNNSPSVGYISWTDVNIQYKGVTYNIENGNTNYIYVYWKYSDPTAFYGSNTFPILGNDDLLVFLNKNGTYVNVPNSTIVDGSLIVPESILTNALSANSITGEKIMAGEVDSTHIKAYNIESYHIKAGSITTDRLAAGGVNPNIVRDGYDTFSQFDVGSTGLTRVSGTVFQIVNYLEALTSDKALYVSSSDGYLAPNSSGFSIPVKGGKTYIVSAYVKRDASGTYANTIGLKFNNTAQDLLGAAIDVPGLSGWQRLAVKITAPAGATKAMFYIKSVNSYYWDAMMVEEAGEYQTEPSAWKPAGTTTIWGGNIKTESITSDKIKAQSITADHIKSLNGLNVNNQFLVDANGNVKFKGYLEGAAGSFSGQLTSTDILTVKATAYQHNAIIALENRDMSNNPDGEFRIVSGGGAIFLDRLDKTFITDSIFGADANVLVLYKPVDFRNGIVINDYINADLKNSWVSYDSAYYSAQYMIDPFNTVRIRGSIKNGLSGTVAFILPDYMRPLKRIRGALLGDWTNAYHSRYEIYPTGEVYIFVGGSNNGRIELADIAPFIAGR